MKKLYIETYGCQMNVADSEVVASVMQMAGYEPTESLDEGGRTVGRLGACNTVGSILGTFLPTFVTIPAVGTAVTFLIFSGVLLLIALAYFLSERTKLRAVIIALVLFLLCLFFGRSAAFASVPEAISAL